MDRLTKYHKTLFQIAAEKKLWMRILGQVDCKPIWYIRTHDGNRHGPRLLIVAGFHGEERAGPLSILAWLENFDSTLYNKVNLSFIPIVNPVGFNKVQRYNEEKEQSNCGFCHPESGDQPSKEGVILLKNFPLLRSSAKHGFLDLHEDVNCERSYIYVYERTPELSDFALQMRGILTQFFPKLLDNEYVVTDARGKKRGLALNGIISNLCDGSFEDYLYHEGTTHCFVTETPAKNVPIKKRILACQAIITEFIKLSIMPVG